MRKWEALFGTTAGNSSFIARAAPLVGSIALALVLGFSGPAAAVDWDDYEYEPGEGLHEEEWYDPSDWFDTGQGISFESDDWWDYGYGYGYDYDWGNGTVGGYNAFPYGRDEYYGISPYYTDEDFGIDQGYTDQWYEEDGVFEGWFD